MAFFFRPFPKIFYDVKKNNNNSSVLTNITARYKIRDILKQRAAIFYDYTVKEGDTPSSVAFRYYEDETLDWLILLAISSKAGRYFYLISMLLSSNSTVPNSISSAFD